MMDGKITITGDASSVLSMMQKSGDAIRGFQTQAESSFGRIQSSISNLQGKWVALGSAVLGGAGFKEAIETSVNLTKEAQALGRALGISATQASIVDDALGDLFQTKETLIVANSKMTATLKDNEKAFTDLGVKTRDQNGHFRSSLDIMLDVNSRLLQFKEGTDRNIEASKIYGKSWNEVSGLLKLNAEMMESSKQKVEALNLAVGEESIEAVAKYRVAMDDVGDVLTAVKRTIGDAVMPVMTQLGNEFSQTGPQKVEFMRKAISVLVAAFYGLKNGVEIVWISVRTVIESLVVGLLTLGEATTKAFTLDFSGAKAAWERGIGMIKDINAKGGQEIVDASVKHGEAMRQAIERGFGPVSVTPSKPGDGGTATSTGGDKSDSKTRIRQWDLELDQQKQAHVQMNAENNTFYEFSKTREAEYWKSILARQDLTQKERWDVERKYTKLMLDLQKELYDARIAGLKLELEGFQNNMAERERIAVQMAEHAKQRYGKESKEYAQAQEELVRITRKRADQQKAIENELREVNQARQNAVIEGERADAQLQESLGLITREQMLAMDADFEMRSYDIKRQALADKLALMALDPDMDPVQRQQLQRQIEELELQHQQRIQQIKNAQMLQRAQPLNNVMGAAESSIEAGMTAMLTRAQTFARGMNSIYRGIGVAFIQELVTKPFVQWAAMWARKLAMNLGFLTAEQSQEAAAAVAGSIQKKAVSFGEIMANAGVAGSGAYAAMAAIPFVGPMIAPAAAATAFAGASAYGAALFSAAGGFDIPAGMNPMVQTHAEEMILPAKLSNGLRDLINTGGPGQGGGETHLHFHGLYNDQSGLKRFFKENGSLVAEAGRGAYRNGWRPK